eukprot:SAG31_NODE_9567_length_1258_cov_1.289905_4_plen_98_part_00
MFLHSLCGLQVTESGCVQVEYKQTYGHGGQGRFWCPGYDQDDPDNPGKLVHKPCNYHRDTDGVTAGRADDGGPLVCHVSTMRTRPPYGYDYRTDSTV